MFILEKIEDLFVGQNWAAVILVVILMVGNVVLSLMKQPLFNRISGWINMALAATGLIGMIVSKSRMKSALAEALELSRIDQEEHEQILSHFSLYIKCILLFMLLVIVFLGLLLVINRFTYSHRFSREYATVVGWSMVFIMVFWMGFSFFVQSEDFPLALYQFYYGFFAALALYSALVLKKGAVYLGEKTRSPQESIPYR